MCCSRNSVLCRRILLMDISAAEILPDLQKEESGNAMKMELLLQGGVIWIITSLRCCINSIAQDQVIFVMLLTSWLCKKPDLFRDGFSKTSHHCRLVPYFCFSN